MYDATVPVELDKDVPILHVFREHELILLRPIPSEAARDDALMARDVPLKVAHVLEPALVEGVIEVLHVVLGDLHWLVFAVEDHVAFLMRGPPWRPSRHVNVDRDVLEEDWQAFAADLTIGAADGRRGRARSCFAVHGEQVYHLSQLGGQLQEAREGGGLVGSLEPGDHLLLGPIERVSIECEKRSKPMNLHVFRSRGPRRQTTRHHRLEHFLLAPLRVVAEAHCGGGGGGGDDGIDGGGEGNVLACAR